MTLKKLTFLCLGAALFFSPSQSSAGILQDKNCGSCHRLSSENIEKVFSGPDLHYAGNKFQLEWIKQFLKTPGVIRPAGVPTGPGFLQGAELTPHPSFSEADVNSLANQLMSLKISGLTLDSFTTEPLSKGQRAKIKYQFERTFSCISCHQSLNLTGKVRGGISGPSLINAGNRLQASWIRSWLSTPEDYAPESRMPRYKMEPDTLDLLTRFLMTLIKENMK